MPRYRTAYPPEFRRQMVDLVRSGRTPEELAREFEPTAQSISTWVKQAERDAGKRLDGPTSAEREELGRLRRENHRLRQDPLSLSLSLSLSITRRLPQGNDKS
jgi:transposase